MRALIGTLMIFATASAADSTVTWRSDYASGRKEAGESSKAVCLVIGSDNCFYCKKLEATTLQDAGVTTTLKQGYVAIKIDAAREPELVKALKISLYPTTVLAGPDGSIHAIINGYVSQDQMKEHLKRTLVVIEEDARFQKDYVAAKAALEAGEISKAAALLRPIVAEPRNRTMQAQAKDLMEKVDRAASNKAIVQAVKPQALLEVAKTLQQANRMAETIDVCNELLRSHPGTLEAKSAQMMMDEIRNNPDLLRTASRQADEKAAALQLVLAESLLKKGDTIAAKASFENVLRLTSNGPMAESAQFQLTKLGGPIIVSPASLKR